MVAFSILGLAALAPAAIFAAPQVHGGNGPGFGQGAGSQAYAVKNFFATRSNGKTEAMAFDVYYPRSNSRAVENCQPYYVHSRQKVSTQDFRDGQLYICAPNSVWTFAYWGNDQALLLRRGPGFADVGTASVPQRCENNNFGKQTCSQNGDTSATMLRNVWS